MLLSSTTASRRAVVQAPITRRLSRPQLPAVSVQSSAVSAAAAATIEEDYHNYYSTLSSSRCWGPSSVSNDDSLSHRHSDVNNIFTTITITTTNNNNNNTMFSLRQQHHQPQQPQIRQYHATQKKEILPLVVGVGFLLVARYSWKALQRMDEEWEEYEWKLQQYEKAHRNELNKSKFKDGTIAVDVGTMFVKLAHNGNGILPTREGARYTFAGVVRTSDDDDTTSNSSNDDVLLGQQAYEKFWEVQPFHPGRVDMARSAKDNNSKEKILLQVITPAIEDALERADLNQQNMRSVVTIPPSAVEDAKDPRNPWKDVSDQVWKNAEQIPEPVAAVWGAQIQGDLPLHDMNTPILVVDMGANATSLTIVEKDVVLANATLDFGAQKYVDAICEHIIETKPKLGNIRNDGMAWQRLRSAAQMAANELNTNSQATLNVPYIGMDLETKQPIHLETSVPRKLIEQKVSDHIVTDLILKHEDSSGHTFLSPHVPVNNMSTLWMSAMTQLLTDINKLPQDLGHVLVVGGGSKHPMIEQSVKECFGFFRTKVAVPALSTRSELIALGASSILPHYEYDLESGLIRNEAEEEEDRNKNENS